MVGWNAQRSVAGFLGTASARTSRTFWSGAAHGYDGPPPPTCWMEWPSVVDRGPVAELVDEARRADATLDRGSHRDRRGEQGKGQDEAGRTRQEQAHGHSSRECDGGDDALI
jgi:hypothetical protein